MKNFKYLSCIAFHLLLQPPVFGQTNSATMENNKMIANQFYSEVINKGDTVLMKTIMADDFIDHNAPPMQPKGSEGFKQFLKMLGSAFPDIQVKVDDMLSDGNKVIVRLTVEGTQTGVLLGNIPPSGMHAVWTGIDILKIENGKITERWSQRDLLGMLRQIGAINK